jgi:hypothetical protein
VLALTLLIATLVVTLANLAGIHAILGTRWRGQASDVFVPHPARQLHGIFGGSRVWPESATGSSCPSVQDKINGLLPPERPWG